MRYIDYADTSNYNTDTTGLAFDATGAFSGLFQGVPVNVIGYKSDPAEEFTPEAIRDVVDKLNAVCTKDTQISFVMEDNPCLTPKAIYRSGKTTTVMWEDETITIVNLREGNEDNPYTAFAYAVLKKLYGGMKEVTRLVDSIHADKIREKKMAEKEARRKEQEERHAANLAKKAAENKKIGFDVPCPSCQL